MSVGAVVPAESGGFPTVAPAEAFATAQARLQDPVLQQRGREYLGGLLPPGIRDPMVPTAVYSPYLARGDNREIAFLGQARQVGFQTVVATYMRNPWSDNRTNKPAYRPAFKLPGGETQDKTWVVEPAERTKGAQEGVGSAQTKYGFGISEYWSGIRRVVLARNDLPTNDTVVDFGGWYKNLTRHFSEGQVDAASSPYYYRGIMAAAALGWLVLWDTPQTAYATKVMRPAYDEVLATLGVAPLVTDVLGPEQVADADTVDLSFLRPDQVVRLRDTGRIEG